VIEMRRAISNRTACSRIPRSSPALLLALTLLATLTMLTAAPVVSAAAADESCTDEVPDPNSPNFRDASVNTSGRHIAGATEAGNLAPSFSLRIGVPVDPTDPAQAVRQEPNRIADIPSHNVSRGTVSAAQQLTTFWGIYWGWNAFTNQCHNLYGIYGKEPAAGGQYPVFMYFVGGAWPVQGSYYGPDAEIMVQEMARRGFVAVSVEYDNASWPTCGNLSEKSKCIFNNTVGSSAIRSVCSRSKADCGKGIVLAGLSQGAQVATLGKNFDDRVQAVYSISGGTTEGDPVFSNGACLNAGNRALPGDRLRAISGESDTVLTGFLTGLRDPGDVRRSLQQLTGVDCSSTDSSCFRDNKSGWYMVRDTEVEDRVADHCYFGKQAGCNFLTPDVGWMPPATHQWSLSTNLDWLKQFVRP
jgi:hypothetical protein